MTDSHAHLDRVAARLGIDAIKMVLENFALENSMQNPGIGRSGSFILDVGVDPGDLASRLASYAKYPFVYFSAGLWPGTQAFFGVEASLGALRRDINIGLESGRLVAIGECGLDYHHMEAQPAEQISLFRAQAAMAVEYNLPLVVHTRDAFDDTILLVSEIAGKVPVIIHCFGYGAEEANRFVEQGCMVSFAGNITYKKSERLCEALTIIPDDRIMFETDSPYMSPEPFRGRPTTPIDIFRTVDKAATLRGVSPLELAEIACSNAAKVFSIA
jgi:TatD DNase family protein